MEEPKLAISTLINLVCFLLQMKLNQPTTWNESIYNFWTRPEMYLFTVFLPRIPMSEQEGQIKRTAGLVKKILLVTLQSNPKFLGIKGFRLLP